MEAMVNGTAEAWRERIAGQRASGQSIRAWCRENNHHEHAFYWWRARLGMSPRSALKCQPRRPAKPIKFAEVVVDRTTCDSMRLRLSNGRELLMPVSMSMTLVAQLLRAIEGAA
jgi:hypothetical protein